MKKQPYPRAASFSFRPAQTSSVRPILLLALLWLLLSGCTTSSLTETRSVATPENVSSENSSNNLHNLQRAARENFLEIQAVESLQQLAGEHVDNQLLLRLPEAVAAAREERFPASSEHDNRAQILDAAIAYNYLLTQERNAELLELRIPRDAELLDCTIATLWSKLAAVNEEIELLGLTPERKQRAEELKLELRVYTGLRENELRSFTFDSLPEPARLHRDLAELQKRAVRQRSESHGARYSPQLNAKCKLFFEYDRATPLFVAEGLLRLPRRLEERSIADAEFRAEPIARLGSAVGAATEIEIDLANLERSYELWRLAKLKRELHPDNPEEQSAEIAARLNWRIAYFRLLADMGTDDRMPPPDFEPEPDPVQEDLLFSLLTGD